MTVEYPGHGARHPVHGWYNGDPLHLQVLAAARQVEVTYFGTSGLSRASIALQRLHQTLAQIGTEMREHPWERPLHQEDRLALARLCNRVHAVINTKGGVFR